MIIFLMLLVIADFITLRQFIVIGLFEMLAILYRDWEKKDEN